MRIPDTYTARPGRSGARAALRRGLVDFPALLPVLIQAATEERMAFTVELDTDNRDEDEELHESYRYAKAWLLAHGLMK